MEKYKYHDTAAFYVAYILIKNWYSKTKRMEHKPFAM